MTHIRPSAPATQPACHARGGDSKFFSSIRNRRDRNRSTSSVTRIFAASFLDKRKSLLL